jgi:hypothetical protein
VITNIPFQHWDTVFPNAACAVALIDRLTHHAEILSIDGESYRKREAEQAQKRKQEQKPKRWTTQCQTAAALIDAGPDLRGPGRWAHPVGAQQIHARKH